MMGLSSELYRAEFREVGRQTGRNPLLGTTADGRSSNRGAAGRTCTAKYMRSDFKQLMGQ